MSYLIELAVASRRWRLWRFFIAATLWVLSSGCRSIPSPAIVELEDARRLAADLRVQFTMASDAANQAVMADTDEASIRFARNAERTAALVENDVATLAPLLRSLRLENELRSLERFKTSYATYRKLDKAILELAVENTNLKAQRLSFGPAREAADRFKSSLEAVANNAAVKDRCHLEALIAKAVLAVREIQVKQAPHIAEPDDAAMTHMEKEMNDLTTTATEVVAELSGLIDATARPSLASAQTALDEFKSVSAELVTLSRRNSNLRSLDLSLREKPALAATCNESLRELSEALAKQGSNATR